jgi:EAL domain-containing protein (putative c-di-GMP-specific phosphodiesterase class I)
MTEQLRHAIADHALEVYHQPKANLASNVIFGFEALVRWPRGDGTLLPPSDFLPLAADAGLMYDLTLVVLARALNDLAALRAAYPELTVAVNVPAVAILDAALARDVERLLSVACLPGSALEIEITEESAVADKARARSLIAGLRALGVAVSIDDYGTGFSSLQYLRDLEVDSLKLDRSVVTGLARSARATKIVDSTIQLAHALGLRVIAEGVESAADWDALTGLRCDCVQGFYLGRPVPFSMIADSLSRAQAA